MKRVRSTIAVLMCVVVFSSIFGTAHAAYSDEDLNEINFKVTRATGSFSIDIPAKTKMIADTSFPLVAGETVRIDASYRPENASVDFGILDENGRFYFFNIDDGEIDKTIRVEDSGDYRLQIRNNSSYSIAVTGFVNY